MKKHSQWMTWLGVVPLMACGIDPHSPTHFSQTQTHDSGVAADVPSGQDAQPNALLRLPSAPEQAIETTQLVHGRVLPLAVRTEPGGTSSGNPWHWFDSNTRTRGIASGQPVIVRVQTARGTRLQRVRVAGPAHGHLSLGRENAAATDVALRNVAIDVAVNSWQDVVVEGGIHGGDLRLTWSGSTATESPTEMELWGLNDVAQQAPVRWLDESLVAGTMQGVVAFRASKHEPSNSVQQLKVFVIARSDGCRHNKRRRAKLHSLSHKLSRPKQREQLRLEDRCIAPFNAIA